MKNYSFFSIIIVLILFIISCEGLYINEEDSGNQNTENTSNNYTGIFTGNCYYTDYTNPKNSGEVGTDLTISISSSGYSLKFNNNPGCIFACAGQDITTYCSNNGSINYKSGSYKHTGSINLNTRSGSFNVYYGDVKQYSYNFSCSSRVK